MNKIASFELAKVLKKKGFESDCDDWAYLSGDCMSMTYDPKTCVKMPTIAEVVMWLYERHNYWITVDVDALDNWVYEITNTAYTRNSYVPTPNQDLKNPDGAYVAAIYHCLTKLIKDEQTNI